VTRRRIRNAIIPTRFRAELRLPVLLVAALVLVGCVLLGSVERVAAPTTQSAARAASGERHIVLLALDGVRPREVFEGSDLVLVRAQRVPVGEHRPAREILPNLHRLIEAGGTALGAPGSNSHISASGPNYLSLPGYAEMLTGRRITACRDNRCTHAGASTVLDDCTRIDGSDVRDCAAITSWPSIARVVAKHRERVALSTGRHGGKTRALLESDPALRQLLHEGARAGPHPGHGDFRPDRYTAELALRYLDRNEPRLLFVGLGEPDEYAHRNDYASYLRSLRAADALIGQITKKLAVLAARGARTAFFITTDHGRADSFVSHGAAHAESRKVWLVAAGTEIPARGHQAAHPPRYLADIAPTMRRLLQTPDDLHPHAGQALHELFGSSEAPIVDRTPSPPDADHKAQTGP
jgi:hypothetical protein